MKIAIPKENYNVCEHFGHCEGFQLYSIEDNNIVAENYIENPGHKPGLLPVFLKDKGVNMIIAGGMGQRAQEIFREHNIQVVTGATGEIESVVKCYLEGNLVSTNQVCSLHMHEGHCE